LDLEGLMPHSQFAALVWLVADARPQLVKALLMSAEASFGAPTAHCNAAFSNCPE
jgi:hypothetical protein